MSKLQDLKAPVAIHCKTEEEADALCRHAREELGVNFTDGYFAFNPDEDGGVCYLINTDEKGKLYDTFSTLELAKEENWNIIELSDLDIYAVTYKYGQMLISNQETEVQQVLSDRVIKIPKGNRAVIGFDGLAHHLKNGYIQPLSKNITLQGYSHTGVVAEIWKFLNLRLPMEEMLEAVDAEPKEVTDAIKEALEEIGLFDYGAQEDTE